MDLSAQLDEARFSPGDKRMFWGREYQWTGGGWKATDGKGGAPASAKKHGWKKTASGYEATGPLAGRASIYRKVGKRGGKGSFVLKLDGKEHDMGKRATFDHADNIVSGR